MTRLYHVLVSMIYGHDTGVASHTWERRGKQSLPLLLDHDIIVYLLCVSIQLIGTLCVDSTDPFSMKA